MIASMGHGLDFVVAAIAVIVNVSAIVRRRCGHRSEAGECNGAPRCRRDEIVRHWPRM